MNKLYHTVVIGGGCLGAACAFSVQRRLGNNRHKVAIIEKKVLGAGLSSRHSAIVRSANASPMAARMAKMATQYWKNLKPLWGVNIPYEQPGAIWIAENTPDSRAESWTALEQMLQQEGIGFAMLAHRDVMDLSRQALKTVPDEIYYYEPDVLQLDSPQILNAMQTAAKKNRIDVLEHCEVIDFAHTKQGISAINTSQGKIFAEHVINAAGAWSAELFAGIGLSIPVALEPVYAANFLVSADDIPEGMPIIADYVNQAYFRRWRGSILHMHQPRSRNAKDIARSFSRAVMNPEGANVIYDALSFNVTHQQLDNYLGKVINRFPKIGKPVYAGGYHSFFDITPDLKFILGPDTQLTNLYHCLGAGQALKYAPIFGEIIADLIIEGHVNSKSIDIAEFSIDRFSNNDISQFWQSNALKKNSL
ncbi:FAD-dependent oxidoreductase [Methylomonas sp. Kb3]|uniref:NAD(P)/FAD-dependent oxidoreductase n=1 Tax=Methylomonas sp. Kb3 TaxID=1611544 RepID=UPI000C339EE1|nr:FAD-binding oxidoreductase [Methylomonas sp. Kb3]PKD39194.1 FAD-dependent oxidoreductase [Methylomonas sp. Kb3]